MTSSLPSTQGQPRLSQKPVSRGIILLMAVACGIIVANLYYNQPLLADIGRTFGADAGQTGLIAMLTQIGYAAGIFLFVPLGDIREKRKMIVNLQLAGGIVLIATAAAQNLAWMLAASFAVGVTSVATQLIIPMSAQLAGPAERGKVVGTVMSGLLIGILMARIVAGFVGDMLHWRAMYGIAAVLMLTMGWVLSRKLPAVPSESALTYPALLQSMGQLFVRQKTLREASLIGACLFGAYSVFWTGLPYFLESPQYALGSSVAGLFGLVGIVSATASPVIGRLTDRVNPLRIVGIMIVVAIIAFLTLGTAGPWIAGLIAGTLLLELGIQGGQVTNQIRIYSFMPEARSRLNTVLMVSSFIGGSIGASAGGYAWNLWGWRGTCTVGVCLIAAALLIWLLGRWKDRRENS